MDFSTVCTDCGALRTDGAGSSFLGEFLSLNFNLLINLKKIL